VIISLFACRTTAEADLIVYNAKIYTVDTTFSVAEAMAIRNGRVLAVGTSKEITSKYYAKEKINASGKFIYPGFIDAHCHFYNYGLGLRSIDLVGTESWEEILGKLQSFAAENPTGWLIGRGWDQNDWRSKQNPDRSRLDSLFPDRPVFLTRVDGHAAIVNQKAIEIAGLTPATKVDGGEVEVKNGQLTGILVDNASDLVSPHIPDADMQQMMKAVKQGETNCFAVGLTTVDDCGLSARTVEVLDSLQDEGLLKMRIYAMLSDAPANINWIVKNGKLKTDRMNVRSMKVYSDGALGSRGACLLAPYNDRPDWYGFLLSPVSHFDSIAAFLNQQDFQMCTHAIGDSANREILNVYGRHLKTANDKRWRIEHAQVVNQNDFALFGKYSVIPSVQPTHATSDMYWAGERLGKEREKGAYAFRQLMEQNGWMPLGTDFPVENISPFKTFYAAVFRMDEKNYPAGGYQPENALSRQQALKGMTIWAARSNFEEGEKGSLESGKFADFIILDRDLMSAGAKDVLSTSVLATYIGGEKVYGK
jgi:predicted amidohydrolase YtcJ